MQGLWGQVGTRLFANANLAGIGELCWRRVKVLACLQGRYTRIHVCVCVDVCIYVGVDRSCRGQDEG